MSIKIMSLVWEKSQHKGSALLLMLALADHADDKGRCWPGMTSLALKTRMGRRNVVKLMERLEKSGEVVVEVRGGQAASNRYRINIELLGSDQLITSERVITTPSEPAITRVVNGRSHESSITVNKTSRKKKSKVKMSAEVVEAIEGAVKTRDIQNAYKECVPYPVKWEQGESTAAKWLAENGYTPDDIKGCYAAMQKDHFWDDKQIRLASISNKIGAWKHAQTSAKVINIS